MERELVFSNLFQEQPGSGKKFRVSCKWWRDGGISVLVANQLWCWCAIVSLVSRLCSLKAYRLQYSLLESLQCQSMERMMLMIQQSFIIPAGLGIIIIIIVIIIKIITTTTWCYL